MRGSTSRIVEQFSRIVHDAPDRALIHLPLSRITMTAADIRAAAEQQWTLLNAEGLGPDDLVIYAAGNRPELFALWLACRSLGAALMPVDAGTTSHEIAALAQRFGARVAIVPETLPVEAIGAAHAFGPGLRRIEPWQCVPAPHLYRGAAVLKLTSGSTGLPRATFTTEAQLIHDTDHITDAMGIGPDDCQMAAIPLSHAYGIGNLVIPLLVQGTPIVMREGFVPHQFAADASAYGARVFPGVPFMFEHFKDHLPPGAWPRALSRLISAGARLESSTARGFRDYFGVKVHSFYGASETGGISFDDAEDIPEDGSVGRPMPGVTITLRPEEGAPGGAGRVHVSGSAVGTGYVGDSPRNDGFTPDGFLTGDFGRFNAGGDLILTGRASSFINVAGRKVQPEEVEQILREMPGIADVRVVGAADPARGQQIVACIVVRGDSPGLIGIRQFCAARLAPYKIPRTIITLERIPLTDRGKTDRQRLQELVLAHLRQAPEAGVL
jgi:acyl-CoA synthetase (AMP-forming)/AMP-acid ligase II